MENCLVTRLRGVVNNDNLKRIGEVEISISSGDSITIRSSYFNNPPAIRLISGGVTCSVGGTPVTLPYTLTSGDIVITATSDSVVSFRSVYDMNQILVNQSNDWDVDAREFEFAPLTWVSVQDSFKFHGDIKYLFKPGNIQTSVTIGNDQLGNNIYGDVSHLGNCTSATTITVRYQTGVTGSIESLVAKFRENNKATGSITIGTNNTGFTFNGSTMTAGNHSLSWTATTITLDGTTITA